MLTLGNNFIERVSSDGPAARRRARRVALLLLAVAVLSLVDLVFTVRFMTTVGMFEANPITVWLIRATGSTLALSIFKVATVVAGGGLLFWLRRCRQAELASWAAVLVLSVLSVHWVRYAVAMHHLDLDAIAIVAVHDPGFVRLD